MRDPLHSLRPLQFGIKTLLLLTTAAAIILGVLCMPGPSTGKIPILLVLFQTFWCWQYRNYLHPLQGSIPFATRRRMAISDFVGSVLIWPPFVIWLYFWRDFRTSHPLSFSDVVFWGALAILFAIATWKLIRALQPNTIWTNLI